MKSRARVQLAPETVLSRVQLAGRKWEEGCSWRGFSFSSAPSSPSSLSVVDAAVVVVVVVLASAVVVGTAVVVRDSN